MALFIYSSHPAQLFCILSVIAHPFSQGDGRLLAAGDDAGRVVVFETESKALLRVLTGHKAAVRAVKWAGGKGGKVTSASDDKTVRLWDVSTGACVLEWEVCVVARLVLCRLLLS